MRLRPKPWRLFFAQKACWLRAPEGKVFAFELVHARHGALDAFKDFEPQELMLERAFEHVKATSRSWLLQPQLEVLLSGYLARPFVCGPAQGLQRWSEAAVLAQSQANEATQMAGSCKVVLESWPEEDAALATAVENDVLDALNRIAAKAGIRIRSIRPWWSTTQAEAQTAVAGLALPGGDLGHGASRLFAWSDVDAQTIIASDERQTLLAFTQIPALSSQAQSNLVHRLMVSEGIAFENYRSFELDLLTSAATWPIKSHQASIDCANESQVLEA